jgi:hypothetical protein
MATQRTAPVLRKKTKILRNKSTPVVYGKSCDAPCADRQNETDGTGEHGGPHGCVVKE